MTEMQQVGVRLYACAADKDLRPVAPRLTAINNRKMNLEEVIKEIKK